MTPNFEEKLKKVRENFNSAMDRKNGVISKSMNVNTKPTHKFYYKDFLVTIDGNLPEQDLLELRKLINTIE
jgi:hypothetical protein